jgi:hypothetical protein
MTNHVGFCVYSVEAPSGTVSVSRTFKTKAEATAWKDQLLARHPNIRTSIVLPEVSWEEAVAATKRRKVRP